MTSGSGGAPYSLFSLGPSLRAGARLDVEESGVPAADDGPIALKTPEGDSGVTAAAEAGRGAALLAAGDADGAVAAYRRALNADPGSAVLWTSLGVALQRAGRLEEAITAHRRAVAREPTLAGAHYNLGVALLAAQRGQDAVAAFGHACRQDTGLAAAWVNLGATLLGLGRLEAAETALQHGASLAPDQPELLLTRGNLARERGDLDAAEAAYRAAVVARPTFAEAHANLGVVLRDRGVIPEAAACLERALRLGLPESGGVQSHLSHLYKLLCRWADVAAIAPTVLASVRSGAGTVHPFAFLAERGGTAADQLLCARAYIARRCPRAAVSAAAAGHSPAALRGAEHDRRRLRLGYLSADFHQHATAVLLAEVIELHDRTGFEVFGYSYGHDDGGPLRARLADGFDHLRDITGQPAEAAAAAIRADGIDILIDLKGHTQGARPEIPALRPAPVQVAWLGYPGTTGAPFIDYAIVDPVVAPPGAEAWFSEALLRLPDCYQPNDRHRPRPNRLVPDRVSCGLPWDGFVFGCFNSSYKITPRLFAVWMRLLSAVPDSVLWLLEAPAPAMAALRREANNLGVAPERVLFAPRRPLADHLARHSHVDLFLDTLPVNAHTTASDALWVGVPVITCTGNAMVGRVAASLLHAVGLPDLVTTNLGDYEALALRLANDRDARLRIRRHLDWARDWAPLFDTPRTVGHLEAGYRMIWERYRAGLPPASLEVAPRPAVPPGNGATRPPEGADEKLPSLIT